MIDPKSKEYEKAAMRAKKTVIASGRGYSWKVPAKSAYPASPASQSLTNDTSAEQQAYLALQANGAFGAGSTDQTVGG